MMRRALAGLLMAAAWGQEGALVEAPPRGEVWLNHALHDLMPYWNTAAALAGPPGGFPTVRCNDGSLVDRARPCAEAQGNASYLRNERYLVALSRQTYAYGVLFHLTGNPGFLRYMRQGVEFLRREAVDRESGGMRTTQNVETGTWGPALGLRNPQELAYGLLGMSFYYYLTRDPEALVDIVAIRNHIFERYYNSQLDALQWQLEPSGATRAEEKRLVAQLDQVNAYMLLMTPLLGEPERSRWKQDLARLSRIMREQFYAPGENVFFLRADRPEDLNLNITGTDFGHTIKALWMMRSIGRMTGDNELTEFAESNGRRVLERAYRAESGSWAGGLLAGGGLNLTVAWWVHCELDQFAASLGLADPLLAARYLPRTFEYWVKYFVDPGYGEVWNSVDGRTHTPAKAPPKAHQWKNGYHSLEHALVGYITARQMHGEPVTLYYGFTHLPEEERLQPYFYRGRVERVDAWSDGGDGTVWRVDFRDVR